MEIIEPSLALLLWTVLSLAWLVLFVTAIIKLLLSKFPGSNNKLIWALIIIFVPVLGPILFFTTSKSGKIRNTSHT